MLSQWITAHWSQKTIIAMENNIPRNTPALLGTIYSRQTRNALPNTHTRIARIDQLRNSLFNRFEKLLEQAQVSNENEYQSNTQKAFGYTELGWHVRYENWWVFTKSQIEKNDRNSTALSQYQTQIETAALVSHFTGVSFPISFLIGHLYSFVCHLTLLYPCNNLTSLAWREASIFWAKMHVAMGPDIPLRYARAKTSWPSHARCKNYGCLGSSKHWIRMISKDVSMKMLKKSLKCLLCSLAASRRTMLWKSKVEWKEMMLSS